MFFVVFFFHLLSLIPKRVCVYVCVSGVYKGQRTTCHLSVLSFQHGSPGGGCQTGQQTAFYAQPCLWQ